MAQVVCLYTRRGRYHCLQLGEQGRDEYPELDESEQRWGNIIDWAVESTQAQPKIRRMAYDQWYFESRQDLEQFVATLLLRFPGCKPPSF